MHNDNALNLFRLERWLWNLALSSQSQIRSGWWFRPFSAQLVCLLTRVFKVFHYISLFQTKIKRNLCCNAFRNVCLCLDNPLVEQVLSWFLILTLYLILGIFRVCLPINQRSLAFGWPLSADNSIRIWWLLVFRIPRSIRLQLGWG